MREQKTREEGNEGMRGEEAGGGGGGGAEDSVKSGLNQSGGEDGRGVLASTLGKARTLRTRPIS